MASVLATPTATPDDLLRMKGGPAVELVDGRLVEKAMGQELDLVGSRLITRLSNAAGDKVRFVFGPHCGDQIFKPDR